MQVAKVANGVPPKLILPSARAAEMIEKQVDDKVTNRKAKQCSLLLLWAAFCVIFLCGFGPPTLIDRTIAPTQRLSAGAGQTWPTSPSVPDLTAKAAVLYDVDAD